MQSKTPKTAFITGGSSGIGYATAQRLAEDGCNVVIISRDRKRGEQAEKLLRRSSNAAVRWIGADVTREDDLRKAVDDTLNAFGRIDLAFNNAGCGAVKKRLDTLTIEEWQTAINGYLTSAWLSMKYELRAMHTVRGGVIVNNASVAGLQGWAGYSAYAAAKHGLIGLSKTAAIEYAAHHIRVNVICPGWIDTPPVQWALGTDKKLLQRIDKQVPLKRAGHPEEVAEMVAWLFSNAAAYITGAVLSIDGGFQLQ